MCKNACGLALAINLSLAAALSAAESFVLLVPGDPSLNSQAVRGDRELVITDATGKRFVYVRKPELDSRDRQYLGFYAPADGRYLRWPAVNAGPMQLGNVAGDMINWTLSRMSVQRVPQADAPIPNASPSSAQHLAELDVRPQTQVIARIDRGGLLQFYLGHGERWKHVPGRVKLGLLVSGAPLCLIKDAGLIRDADAELPTAYTVGARGEVLEIKGGQRARKLTGVTAEFAPGSDLDAVFDQRTNSLFAVDTRGRIWELDASTGRHQLIESKNGLYEPGIPLRAVGPGGAQIFLVDRRGNLVAYRRVAAAEWLGPELVAQGLTSGTPLAVWWSTNAGANAEPNLAAVDHQGQLQVFRQGPAGWSAEVIPDVRTLPGTPVAAFQNATDMSLAVVLPDGRLLELIQAGGTWLERPIADGFSARAPLVLSGVGPSVFAVDAADRIVAGTRVGGTWQNVLCLPDFPERPPVLGKRKLILNRDLTPADIVLDNPSKEHLVVRVIDRRVPDRIQEIAIPPGGSAKVRADRDEGGTLEEAFVVRGPGGRPVEEVRQIQIPPQLYYDVAVYAKRTTYEYVDRRKKKGPVPDFEERSLVSLGAFPLLPGELLRQGSHIDVYHEAVNRRNPAANTLVDPIRQ